MLPSIGLILGLAAAVSGVNVGRKMPSQTPKTVDQAYIIELEHDSKLAARSFDADRRAHEAFHKRAAGLDYSIRYEFSKPALFYGLSIKLNNNLTASEAKVHFKAIKGVKNIWPVIQVNPAVPQPQQSGEDNRPRPTTTDTLIPPKATGNIDVQAALRMAGVDKLHAMGIKGKGVKVGIIDTGVDYRHPALGGGFGPGHKIAGGYAFVDDNSNPIQKPDPLTTCPEGGHGTHVAGIIGMQDPHNIGFNLVGVAPEAEIYMYRVFGCTDGVPSDIVIAALDRAHSDGVDVVNLSLGSTVQYTSDDPYATATKGLVAAGIAVIAAAGNDGVEGPFHPSSPAIGRDVIGIGSVDNTVFPVVYGATDSRGFRFNYASVWPFTSPRSGFPVYVIGPGSGCQEAEWEKANQTVTNKQETIIILSADGDCLLTDYIPIWTKYGFTKIAAYRGWDEATQYTILDQRDDVTIYASLLKADGLRLIQNYQSVGGYPHYKMLFQDKAAKSVPMETAGKISYFSSYGPDWLETEQTPQLSAPGAAILATWPLGFNGGYGILRGTSMASPFAAGCYALVKSQRPKLTIHEIRQLLQSTSTPVLSPYASTLATTVQQGAGLINPYNALQYKTIISPTQFEVGDAADYSGHKFNFTIKNTSPRAQKYTIEHKPAGMDFYWPSLNFYPVDQQSTVPQPVYASLHFSTTEITIKAGDTSTVFFTITPPPKQKIDSRKVLVMSGFLSIQSSSGEKYNLPYEGIPYNRHDSQHLAYDNPPIIMEGADVANPLIYSSASNGTFLYCTGADITEFLRETPESAAVLFGTFKADLDRRVYVLPANTTFKPTAYGYNPSIKLDYAPTHQPYQGTWIDGKTPVFASIESGISGINYPSSYGLFWDQVQTASAGDYRFLITSLRWGGKQDNPKDWETYLTPAFRLT